MKRVFVLLASFVLACGTMAQNPPTDWQTQATLPVVVTENGRAVTGLKEADFAVHGPKDSKVVGVREVAPMQMGEKKPIVLVFDTVANPVAIQNPARSAILRYLAKAVTEGQPLHIIAITDKGADVAHSSGTPPAVTLAALKKLDGETKLFNGTFNYKFDEADAKQKADQVTAEYQRLRAFLKDVHSATVFRTVDEQLLAFQAIGTALSRAPGRKALIWFSSYFPVNIDEGHQRVAILQQFTEDTNESRSFSINYEKAVRILNASSVSVYPAQLDRSGLRLSGGQQGADTYSSFKQFADRTGGEIISYDERIEPMVEAAQRDCESYYAVDLKVPQPSHIEWHTISVKVSKPNVAVRKPDGLFSLPPQK